jgi:hypothetical protein
MPAAACWTSHMLDIARGSRFLQASASGAQCWPLGPQETALQMTQQLYAQLLLPQTAQQGTLCTVLPSRKVRFSSTSQQYPVTKCTELLICWLLPGTADSCKHQQQELSTGLWRDRNGVTDDTAAVRAAVAATNCTAGTPCALFFPAGR